MEPETATLSGADALHASPLVEDLGFLLARASAVALARTNTALAEHGLRARSYSVLALAVAGGRPSQRDLAEFLRLDPSQVVALIDDLEQRGLARREPDPRNRRANVVVATDEGRRLHAAASESARAQHARSGLGAADHAELTRLLRTVAFPADDD